MSMAARRATSQPESRPGGPSAASRSRDQPWGRVLICGGTSWKYNGVEGRHKSNKGDVVTPVKLRAISHLKIVKLIGGPTANYSIVIDSWGTAHMFGRIPFFGLEDRKREWNTVSAQAPLSFSPLRVGVNGQWVGGAVGKSHFFLIDSSGRVWAAGDNRGMTLGVPGIMTATQLVHVRGPWEDGPDPQPIIQVATGYMFSLFLTASGEVYACGRSEHGVLGNGTTGERILKGGKTGFDHVAPQRIEALKGKHIVQVACGNHHAIALDREGNVYVWGCNMYARLGLGDHEDRCEPTLVTEFAHNRPAVPVSSVYAGPTSSVVITSVSRDVCIAGKWRFRGDGSLNAPDTRFRLLQVNPASKVSLGFISHFATLGEAPEGEYPRRSFSWGQGATHGELGHGGEWLSVSDPTMIPALDGVQVMDIAAGLCHTLFLVQPDEALEERIGFVPEADNDRRIMRWPKVKSPEECIVCHEEDVSLPVVECERCEEGYHIGCAEPPLDAVPDGEWFCPRCVQNSWAMSHPDESAPSDVLLNGRSVSVNGPSAGTHRPARSADYDSEGEDEIEYGGDDDDDDDEDDDEDDDDEYDDGVYH